MNPTKCPHCGQQAMKLGHKWGFKRVLECRQCKKKVGINPFQFALGFVFWPMAALMFFGKQYAPWSSTAVLIIIGVELLMVLLLPLTPEEAA